MPARRPLQPGSAVTLLRPLLACHRQELRDLLRRRGLAWLEDPSNADLTLRRNRVRHRLLPFLKDEFGADPAAAALRLIRQGEALGAWLDEEAARCDLPPIAQAATPLALPRATLAAIPAAVGGWYLAGLLRRLGAGGAGAAERVLALAAGPSGRRLDLGGGLCACCDRDALIIAQSGSPAPPAEWLAAWRSPTSRPAAGLAALDWPQAELPTEGLTLPAQGRVVLDANWALTLRRTDAPMPPPTDARAARFDLDALALPLRLVHPRPGQRIRLLDGPGSRKLSDLFIDRKLPAAARRRLPVLLDARDEVLWVPGLARGSAAPLAAATAACLCLDLEANSR